MDREVRLYIQGHSFKMEGEKYGFFPVDVAAAWMVSACRISVWNRT
ncbi:hypothetical protein [Bradyrhizobium sp. WU425]|nr:hypothetical protein [Bradyrhizobium canariense]UFW72874.1 hypothetical protein BcanWU425_03640 [Bradyrhizobium canariense]